MIRLLLSLHICAFTGHHLFMHGCMDVSIATNNELTLTVCVCVLKCVDVCFSSIVTL